MVGNDMLARRLDALERLAATLAEGFDGLLKLAAAAESRLDAVVAGGELQRRLNDVHSEGMLRATQDGVIGMAALVGLGKYLEATGVLGPGAGATIRAAIARDTPDLAAGSIVLSVLDGWANETAG